MVCLNVDQINKDRLDREALKAGDKSLVGRATGSFRALAANSLLLTRIRSTTKLVTTASGC